MGASRVLLIRHGESTWNAVGRWQGWGDPPLSERGSEQGRALAARLAGSGLVRLFSSDLARAAGTAAILGRVLGLEVTLDPRLRERDLGRWSGLTGAEIAAAFPDELASFRARDPSARPGGGESRTAFLARVLPAFGALAEAAEAGPLAVVTHLGVIRLLLPDRRPGNAEVVGLDAGALRRPPDGA